MATVVDFQIAEKFCRAVYDAMLPWIGYPGGITYTLHWPTLVPEYPYAPTSEQLRTITCALRNASIHLAPISTLLANVTTPAHPASEQCARPNCRERTCLRDPSTGQPFCERWHACAVHIGIRHAVGTFPDCGTRSSGLDQLASVVQAIIVEEGEGDEEEDDDGDDEVAASPSASPSSSSSDETIAYGRVSAHRVERAVPDGAICHHCEEPAIYVSATGRLSLFCATHRCPYCPDETPRARSSRSTRCHACYVASRKTTRTDASDASLRPHKKARRDGDESVWKVRFRLFKNGKLVRTQYWPYELELPIPAANVRGECAFGFDYDRQELSVRPLDETESATWESVTLPAPDVWMHWPAPNPDLGEKDDIGIHRPDPRGALLL